MPRIEIKKERCKSCELCISFCNRKCLKVGEKVNANGFFVVRLAEADGCNACGLCAMMCPDNAIEVYK